MSEVGRRPARSSTGGSGEYRVSAGVRVRRVVLKALARLVFRALGKVKLTGFENIPHSGAYVVAVNHISIFDPPLALAFWPSILEAIGAVDVFDRPVQGDLLRLYSTIPVHRGEIDRELIEAILARLRAGCPVMIAPEGGRSHVVAMRRAKPGIGYILSEAQVPVVPVGIVGTTGDFLRNGFRLKRPLLELRVGPPFTLPPVTGRGEARRLARQRNADLVMQHIAVLLPPEYRGVYA